MLFAVAALPGINTESIAILAAETVSVERFIARSEGFDLVEVSLHSGREQVSAKIEEGAISKERLRGLSKTFDGAVNIAQTIVSTNSGRLNVDLVDRVGAGVTRSNILMADLLATTIPLVCDLGLEHRIALADFLAYETDSEQLSFDFEALEEDNRSE